MIDKTDSIEGTVLIDRNFIIGLYHVLREICQKFDRVSSVKRTSLYFKSRVRPAIKTTLPISQNFTTRVGSQTVFSAQPRSKFTIKVNPKISKILIIYKTYIKQYNLTHCIKIEIIKNYI